MSLARVLAEHDNVAARAAQADARADAAIAALLSAISSARAGGAASIASARDAAAALPTILLRETKSVNSSLNAIGRAVDASTTPPDSLVEIFSPSAHLPARPLARAVTTHLLRSGLVDLSERFACEAGVRLDARETAPFAALCGILAGFRAGDLAPALRWVAANKGRLAAAGSDVEIRLHRLAYIRLLQTGRRAQALAYAREHLSKFPGEARALGGLMTCLLFAGRLGDSPYKGWIAAHHQDEIERALTREYCAALGFPPESELVTIVRCGANGLPNLLKAVRVASLHGHWSRLDVDDSLPVEMDVGRECRFHSIFTCPVSREETVEVGNVPMMLPCGHVLSKHSIGRLPRTQQRFKCPYCPREQLESDCCELRF